MSALFSTLGVITALSLVIILMMWLANAGLKATFANIKAMFSNGSNNLRNAGDQLLAMSRNAANNGMKVINLTTGTCECCGRTYVGTTDDSDCPLQQVEFQGIKKMLCTSCLEKLVSQFKKSSKSKETKFSSSAEALRGLLASCSNAKDDNPKE